MRSVLFYFYFHLRNSFNSTNNVWPDKVPDSSVFAYYRINTIPVTEISSFKYFSWLKRKIKKIR